VDWSSAEGALVEMPKAPRGVRAGRGCLPSRRRKGPQNGPFLVLYLSRFNGRNKDAIAKGGGNCLLLPHTGCANGAINSDSVLAKLFHRNC